MPSASWNNLTASIAELRRIYLDAALANPTPTDDEQELTRAFVVLAHAELEHFVEEIFRDLANVAFRGAVGGNFSKPSIALIAFSGIPSLAGGDSIGSGKKAPRKLSARFGEAHAKYLKILDENHGVRNQYLAAMAIPLGLDADKVENTWLNELERFCAMRGAFAHASRSTSSATHLSVNPHDVWSLCERLIWTDPATASSGLVSSFESLDEWAEGEKSGLGPVVKVTSWRLRILSALMSWRRSP